MAEMIDQLRTVKASERELYVQGTEILRLGTSDSKK